MACCDGQLPLPASACCRGSCGAPSPSRYPPPASVARPDPASWAVAPAPALPQFAEAAEPCQSTEPWTYAGEHLAALDFPLGGLGAGNVYLMGDGALGGWTVVNQVRNEGLPMHCMPGTFFGVSDGAQSFALLTPKNYTAASMALPPHCAAHTAAASVARLQALPGIRGLSVRGTFPIAEVTYDIPGFPVALTLEALTAMVPTETKDSSLPATLFRFTAKNEGTEAVALRLLQAQQNFVGWDGEADCTKETPFWGGNVNTPEAAGAWQGLAMSSVSAAGSSSGTLAVGGVGGDVSLILKAASEEELWQSFVAGGERVLCPRCCKAMEPTEPSEKGKSWVGGVVQALSVPAGGSATATFVLAWHFPNRTRKGSRCGDWHALPEVLGNHYATVHQDASAVAKYAAENFERLYCKTKLYRDTLFATSIDAYILDCAAGRLACATGPTMWRCADGTVLGTEGNGCCPLNCSHVYGYCTLLERLFPELARDMLSSNFGRNFDKDKGVSMRFGRGGFAIDGSLASVIKAYLVVQQSDSALEWLPSVWENVKVQMELAMRHFDSGDGVIRVAQQNTYDTSMLQANTFIGSYYVTALRAAAAMATLMQEPELSALYSQRAELSAKAYEKICWREDFGYYVADVTAKDCQHSYGPGCFIDQLCAIGLSSAVGFGHIFEPEHEARARKAIAAQNKVHMPPFKDLQHHFFPGDTGLAVCSYPHGKLGQGMTYDSLVSIGFEYPVVAGLLLDGSLEEAEAVARNIRSRHDGRNRSPWNEPECGLLYSRAMAAWNLLDQAVGFGYDATEASLSFEPRYNAQAFRCFFVAQGAWGEFKQAGPAGLAKGTASLKVLHGSLSLKSLKLASSATAVAVSGTVAASASIAAGVILFKEPLTLPEGTELLCTLSSPEDEEWCHIEELRHL